jgi:hypothetical protein
LRKLRVGLAPPCEFKAIRRHLWRQSLSWGTRLTPAADGLVLNFEAADVAFARPRPRGLFEPELALCAA